MGRGMGAALAVHIATQISYPCQGIDGNSQEFVKRGLTKKGLFEILGREYSQGEQGEESPEQAIGCGLTEAVARTSSGEDEALRDPWHRLPRPSRSSAPAPRSRYHRGLQDQWSRVGRRLRARGWLSGRACSCSVGGASAWSF